MYVKHPRLHEFSSTGDLYGGMWVLATDGDGDLYMESWRGPDEGDSEPVYPWTTFTVFRVALPDDVAHEYAWAYPFDNSNAEAGRAPDPVTRAHELAAVGDYFGWEELDQYPLKLTATELWERWGDPSEDPRRGYLDETYDEVLLDGSATRAPKDLSDREREALFNHGIARLYAALVSSEMAGWDFWQALAEAVRRTGKTHSADAGGDTLGSWTIEQTAEHLRKMEGSGMPRVEAVAFIADTREGVAKVLRPCERDEDRSPWPRWQEEKP